MMNEKCFDWNWFFLEMIPFEYFFFCEDTVLMRVSSLVMVPGNYLSHYFQTPLGAGRYLGTSHLLDGLSSSFSSFFCLFDLSKNDTIRIDLSKNNLIRIDLAEKNWEYCDRVLWRPVAKEIVKNFWEMWWRNFFKNWSLFSNIFWEFTVGIRPFCHLTSENVQFASFSEAYTRKGNLTPRSFSSLGTDYAEPMIVWNTSEALIINTQSFYYVLSKHNTWWRHYRAKGYRFEISYDRHIYLDIHIAKTSEKSASLKA